MSIVISLTMVCLWLVGLGFFANQQMKMKELKKQKDFFNKRLTEEVGSHSKSVAFFEEELKNVHEKSAQDLSSGTEEYQKLIESQSNHILDITMGIDQYEQFFDDLSGNVENALERLKDLLSRRHEMALDPDIRALHELVEELYNFLLGYSKNEKKERKEEQ